MRSPVSLALLSGVAALAIVAGLRLVRSFAIDPTERERRRRLSIHRRGRMGDAIITDVADGVLYYSYTIRGVEYTASQDVSALKQMLPPDPAKLIGPATLKFLSRNPFNSIVVCEEWAGFRKQQENDLPKGA
jgi:hypothetical protein